MKYQKAQSTRRVTRKRVGVAIAFAAVTALALSGCSGGTVPSSSSSKATTIVVWHQATGAGLTVLEKIVKDFNASQTQYVVQPQFGAASDKFDAKLINALKNNAGPNMVLGDSTPQNLAQVIATGKVVNLDSKLSSSSSSITKASFTAGMLATGTFSGKVYSLPTDGGDYGLVYNKAKFAAAGITTPPTTWAELAADAVKLTKGTQQYGIYLPIGTGEWPVFTWQSMLWSANGEFLNAGNTAPLFNSAAGVKALTAWTDMVKNGSAYPQSLQTPSDGQGIASLSSGKVAMVITGAYNLGPLDTALGANNVGVAALPGIDKPAMNVGTDNSYLLKGSAAQEAGSWAFLQYWLKPSVQAQWDIATGYLPTNNATASDPTWMAHLAKNPRLKIFAAELKYAQSRPSIAAYGAVSAALATELEKAMLLQESPAAALNKAAAAAQAALK